MLCILITQLILPVKVSSRLTQFCIKQNNVKHNLQINSKHCPLFRVYPPGFFQNDFCFQVNVNDFVVMPNIQLRF